MPSGGRTIEVQYTGTATDLQRASKDASDAVDKVGRSADDVGEAFDGTASKSAQLAGGLGDLGGALSTMGGPLGSIGTGMELLGPLVMGVTGFMDLASLASTAYAGATRVLTLALAALPFILIAVLIAAVIAGVILLYQHSETFRNIVQAAWQGVQAAVSVAWSLIGRVFDLWLLQFRLAWEVAQRLGSIVAGVWSGISAGVSEAVGWVTGKLGELVGLFTGLPASLRAAASGLWSFLTDGFRTALNTVIGWWNNFEISIGPISIPFAPDIPKITIGTPNLPMFARGGIAYGPTLGIFGEAGPEALVPLPSRGGLLGGSTFVQVDVHVPPTANPAETGRAVAGALRSYFSAGGRLTVPA